MQVLMLSDDAGGRCAVVSLAGQATIADRTWVRCLLEIQAAERPTRMVADLSRLSSLDWWATLLLVWV
jgi:hypothetical protein